jgi:hypothetical protein
MANPRTALPSLLLALTLLTASSPLSALQDPEPADEGRGQAVTTETAEISEETSATPPPEPPAEPAPTLPFEATAFSPDGPSAAAAWADFDGDGRVDLAVAGDSVEILRGDGAGGFTPIELPDVDTSGTTALSWADYDNDGDPDLYLARSAGLANLLLANQPDGFGVAEAGELDGGADADSTAACWADFDGNGHLDLFVASRGGADDLFYSNQGDGRFTRTTEGAVATSGGDGRACAAGDLNADGLVDLFVGNHGDEAEGEENFLYVNLGGGRFVSRPFSVTVTERGHTTSARLVDYDYDLDLDLMITNAGDDGLNVLFLNDGSARFSKVFESPLVGDAADSTAGQIWGDLDNDGHLDAYLVNGVGTGGQPNRLFLADGELSFDAVVEGEAVTRADSSRAAAAADFDRDGDLDVLVVNEDGTRLYRNDSDERLTWLALRLQGKESNRMGLGARVKVWARIEKRNLYPVRWLLSAGDGSEPVLHFGMDLRGRPLELEITWPSGRVDKHTELERNRTYLAVEGGELVEQ